jgi:hypothetical protein
MNHAENLLDPLDHFYLASDMPVPEATETSGEQIPEPYRSLLVHQDDMTPTLEAAYRQRIHLRLLDRKMDGEVMLRQVVLVLDTDDRPVEFGAIRIQLTFLPPKLAGWFSKAGCHWEGCCRTSLLSTAASRRPLFSMRADADWRSP